MESDTIEGLVIRSFPNEDELFEACRTGDAEDVGHLLSSWGPRAIPVAAMLEAIAWSRVDVVKQLLVADVSMTAKGSVSTPGGSGLMDHATNDISAIELSDIMLTAGRRPRLSQKIRALIQEKRLADEAADEAAPAARAAAAARPAAAKAAPAARPAAPAARPKSAKRGQKRPAPARPTAVADDPETTATEDDGATIEGDSGGTLEAPLLQTDGALTESERLRIVEQNVRELRARCEEQARVLAEQNQLIRALYAAGSAAATALLEARPVGDDD